MMGNSAHQEIVHGTEHAEGRAAARGFSPDRNIARASALQDCAIRECAVRQRCSSSLTLHTCGLCEYSKAEQTAHRCWRMCGMHATQGNTPQHTATHCNTLQHTATHGNSRQLTARHCKTRQDTGKKGERVCILSLVLLNRVCTVCLLLLNRSLPSPHTSSHLVSHLISSRLTCLCMCTQVMQKTYHVYCVSSLFQELPLVSSPLTRSVSTCARTSCTRRYTCAHTPCTRRMMLA